MKKLTLNTTASNKSEAVEEGEAVSGMVEPITPTKQGLEQLISVDVAIADPDLVTFDFEVKLLAELYSGCIGGEWPLHKDSIV